MAGFVIRVPASLLVVALAAECQRAPPEEIASRATTAGTPASVSSRPAMDAAQPALDAPATAGRCLRPTPAEAPAQVPVGPAVGCPADPEPSPPKVAVVRVTFPEESGLSVDAEFVRTEHDTMRGLMYRTSMSEDRGMLFDLRVREDHKFWMHNTCIPLDMLFVDEDGFIVGIVENAPTLNDESRGVGCPSRWVLEVNAGWTRRHGVKAGAFAKWSAG
jgi:uncharacterized membrane protein (UPF0127 family)